MEKLEHSDLQTHKSLEETFLELAEKWRYDAETISSPTKKLNHPAYQQIVRWARAETIYSYELQSWGGDLPPYV